MLSQKKHALDKSSTSTGEEKRSSAIQTKKPTNVSLIAAVKAGDVSKLATLLGEHPFPSDLLINNVNNLTWAVMNNSTTVPFLLEHANYIDDIYVEALKAARRTSQWDIVKHFLTLLHQRNKMPLLEGTFVYAAWQCDDIQLIKEFLAKKINVSSAFSDTKENALHCALVRNDLTLEKRAELVQTLINAGADLYHKDEHNKTPYQLIKTHFNSKFIKAISESMYCRKGGLTLPELYMLQGDYRSLVSAFQNDPNIGRGLTMIGKDQVKKLRKNAGTVVGDEGLQSFLSTDQLEQKKLQESKLPDIGNLFADIQNNKFRKASLELMAEKKDYQLKERLFNHIMSLPEQEQFNVLNNSLRNLDSPLNIVWKVKRGMSSTSSNKGFLNKVSETVLKLRDLGYNEETAKKQSVTDGQPVSSNHAQVPVKDPQSVSSINAQAPVKDPQPVSSNSVQGSVKDSQPIASHSTQSAEIRGSETPRTPRLSILTENSPSIVIADSPLIDTTSREVKMAATPTEETLNFQTPSLSSSPTSISTVRNEISNSPLPITHIKIQSAFETSTSTRVSSLNFLSSSSTLNSPHSSPDVNVETNQKNASEAEVNAIDTLSSQERFHTSMKLFQGLSQKKSMLPIAPPAKQGFSRKLGKTSES